jgi:hypothetical protein
MKIICENQRGNQISFGYFPPLWVGSISGLGSDFNVHTSKNSGQDGENYNGSDATKRNILIVLDIQKADFLVQRNNVYNFYQPRSFGTFYYYEDDEAKKIAYQVEKVEPAGTDNDPMRHLTISLICPNPKFYAIEDEISELAMWEGCIEFPLEIIEPFEVTRKVNTLIGNVYNGSNVTQGLTVKFMATGEVTNPSLYDINRHLMMQINITMHSGDVITVTTEASNKRVKLSSGGIESNINNRMLYPPVWLQAYEGDNLYRYNAESGIDSLSVSILHTQAYWGA